MRVIQKEKWKDIQSKVKNVGGQKPKSQHCVKNAVKRVQASGRKSLAIYNYKNCGRRRKLTPQEEKKVVAYVQQWRKKLFCTCEHIKKELKLDVSRLTILRTLSRHHYHWRQVAKKSPLKPEHIEMRKEFVDKHLHHRPSWWVENVHLILDGVTLTKAPKKMSGRQKHAAQAIKAMWMKKGESMDPDLHSYNRYSALHSFHYCAGSVAGQASRWLVLFFFVCNVDIKSMGCSWASRSPYGEASTLKVGLL